MQVERSGGVRALDVAVALISIAVSAWVAVSGLTGEVWFDEFWTLALVEPGTTPLALLQKLQNDAHPYLYFGVVWLGQALGLESVAGLRGLNLLALVLIAAPLYAAVRGGDLSLRTALLILVLAIGSRIFARYLPELRPYLLTYGAAVGLSIVWAAYARRALHSLPMPGHLLALWAFTLGALCNLQYFGCIQGGILTALLLSLCARQGLWRPAIILGLVSAAVAAPAVAMAWFQAKSSIASDMSWVTTTPAEAIRTVARVLAHAGLANPGAVLAALLAVFLVVRARRGWADLVPALGLLLATGLFLAVVMAVNLMKPWIIDRYLLAAAGSFTVALAMLAADPAAVQARPRAMRALYLVACIAAPALVVALLAAGKLTQAGWGPSTAALRAVVQACPTTRLYSGTSFASPRVGPEYGLLVRGAKRYGHAYYLKQAGLTASELAPGEIIATSDRCPAVVWIEHVFARASVPPFLKSLRVPTGARMEVRYVGSGALIFVSPPAAP